MKKLMTLACAAALFCAPLNTAQAAPVEYEFDTVHSQIIFFVDHLGFAKSEGEFLDFDGMFIFDQENVENSKLDVQIETASIDMDNEPWDKHMKNADFFDVEKYPHMTFKSTAIEKTGEDTGKVTGDLTILDVTRPVTLDVKLNKAGTHPRSGKQHAGFSATGMIKRSDWGMTYGVPAVGDDVEIRIEIEASAKENMNE